MKKDKPQPPREDDLPVLKKETKREIAKEKKRQDFLKKLRERY
jgi:hypothetical protein